MILSFSAVTYETVSHQLGVMLSVAKHLNSAATCEGEDSSAPPQNDI